MTEKIARRGVRVPLEYGADFLDTVPVREMMSATVVSLRAEDTIAQAVQWIRSEAAGTSHQGFPVVDPGGHLVGVLTRRNLLGRKVDDASAERTLGELVERQPIVVYDDLRLRAAADHMVNHDVGRLPVVSRTRPGRVVGIVTRSDLLRAHRRRLQEVR